MNDVGLIKIHPDKSIDTLLTTTPNGQCAGVGVIRVQTPGARFLRQYRSHQLSI